VLGPDGEPLFVPINADKAELRVSGCTGSLRLEAVDADYRSVNAPVAFVELGAEEAPRNAGSSDGNTDLVRIGFEAMTRTVEAMQRAQVERERAFAVKEKAFADAQVAAQRMHTDLLIALCDRVGGGKPQDPLSIIRQQNDIRRALEQATPRNSGLLPQAAPTPSSDDGAVPKWVQTAAAFGPAALEMGILSVAKGDANKANELRRNYAPIVNSLSAVFGGMPSGVPGGIPAVVPMQTAAPVAVHVHEPLVEDAVIIDERPTLPKPIREAFARLDDGEAEAFDSYWDDVDEEQADALAREAAAIRDLDERTEWARNLIRGKQDGAEDEPIDEEPTAAAPAAAPAETPTPVAGLDVPPALFPVLMKLTPEEQAAGIQLLSVLDRASIDKIVAQLVAMPPEKALATVRASIDNARKRSASVAHRAVMAALSEAGASGDAS
jgi:hypothetical protein